MWLKGPGKLLWGGFVVSQPYLCGNGCRIQLVVGQFSDHKDWASLFFTFRLFSECAQITTPRPNCFYKINRIELKVTGAVFLTLGSCY